MAGALHHRGPDEFGLYRDARVGLAHARLSIIDLATGQQPMSERGRHAVDRVQRRDLQLRRAARRAARARATASARRATPRSSSTPTRRGARRLRALQRAVGDRAVGLARAETLVLARDRLGVRPLYLCEHDGRLCFASEVKAIFAGDPVDPARVRPDRPRPRPSRSGRSSRRRAVFAGHRRARARARAHLRGERHDGRARTGSRAIRSKARAAFTRLARRRGRARCARRSSEATRLRMLRADVPVGSYLSGGLDSSLIAALGRRATGDQFRTFSLRFEDAEYDETALPAAMVAARSAASTTRSWSSRADIADVFPDVVAPRRAPAPAHRARAAVPALAAGARRRASRWCSPAKAPTRCSPATTCSARRKVRRFWAQAARLAAAAAAARAALSVPGALAGLAAGDGARVLRARPRAWAEPGLRARPRWQATAALQRLFSPDHARRGRARRRRRAAPRRRCRPSSRAGRSLAQDQYLEMRTLLSGYLLSSQGDRMLMAHSVEGRFPFLDADVVGSPTPCPPFYKLAGSTRSTCSSGSPRVSSAGCDHRAPQAALSRPRRALVRRRSRRRTGSAS